MRISVILDDSLVAEALKCVNARTKTALLDLALRELVRQRRRADIRQLRGKGLIDPSYDHRSARKTK